MRSNPSSLDRNLRAYLVHVQRADLRDQRLQRLLGQRTGLLEDDDAVAYRHDRRNRPDVEVHREVLLRLGVDLAEHDVRVPLREPLVHGRERPTRSTPRGPEVHQHDPVGAGDLLEGRYGQRLGRHDISDRQLRYEPVNEGDGAHIPPAGGRRLAGERSHSGGVRTGAMIGRCPDPYWFSTVTAASVARSPGSSSAGSRPGRGWSRGSGSTSAKWA